MIVVERAPPYLTVQDLGRPGLRASGVPACGAMDRWSYAIANALVGNEWGAAAFEWAIAGGSVRFDDDTRIALSGATVEATVNGREVDVGNPIRVHAGDLLEIKRFVRLRFLYVAVTGGIDCPMVLGSRSTYLPAAFGGIDGRRLKTGDRIPPGKSRSGAKESAALRITVQEAPDFHAQAIRFVAASDALPVESEFVVSPASDRMGYRLERARVDAISGASVTSEPVCAGTIQLPPDGQPIVLMADSPTVGGYRVAGTVISCDLPILAQCVPGRRIMLRRVSVEDAQIALRLGKNAPILYGVTSM